MEEQDEEASASSRAAFLVSVAILERMRSASCRTGSSSPSDISSKRRWMFNCGKKGKVGMYMS